MVEEAPQVTRRKRAAPAVIAIVLIVLVGSGGFAWWRSGLSGLQKAPTTGNAPGTAYATATVRRGDLAVVVAATGTLGPSNSAQIGFASAGKIAEILVKPGDVVKAGQVLAKEDTAVLENGVARAESALHTAQINLEVLKSGATPAEIAAAQAALNSARANYARLTAPPPDADVKSDQQAVANAQAALAQAQAALTTLQQGPSPDDIAIAKADLDTKQAALAQAQAAYDGVSWRGDIGSRPEALALQSATNAFIASQATYHKLIAPPNPQDIASDRQAVASAQAALAAAQAKLAQLLAGASASDIAAAQASVAGAQAQLALKQTPSSANDIALGQEQVVQAQIALDAAEADLKNATLVAPFDGTVAALNGAVGQWVGGGAVGTSFIQLVNLNQLQIAAQVNEADMARLAAGNTAQFTVNAFPGQTFTGRVSAIQPVAASSQNVVSYAVTIAVDHTEARLLAGMTANVNIAVESRKGVLVVPVGAISAGQSRYGTPPQPPGAATRAAIVTVLSHGEARAQDIQYGTSDGHFVEVASGLQDGDVVVVGNK